jgi:DNA-directed RNA polymerase subunit RPC12/RpoP
MTRIEVLDLIQKDGQAKSLPRKVSSKLIIASLKKSMGCGAYSLLVVSRQGGFISLDCLQCGTRSAYVGKMEIPDLACEACGIDRVVEVNLVDGDYWYKCTRCRRSWKLGDILPSWSELFEYSGLGAPGDPSYWR